MSTPGERPRMRSRAFAYALLAMAAGLVLTRFVDLARQSPWNDEVCNWMWALEWPKGATPPHPLTYAGIKASLRLGSNDVFFLRLPSAMLMSAIGLSLMAWLWRSTNPRVAGAFAAAWVLSPMAIFYSQDANHYGWVALAGVAAMVGAWRWWEGQGWRRIVELMVLGGVCAAMKLAHPMAVFAAAGLGIAVVIDVMRRPQALPFLAKVPPLAVRGVFGGLLVVAIATAVTLAQAQALGAAQGRLMGAVYFTLAPEFQARLLANAFGAYFHFHMLDYVTGIACFVACVAGWWWLARDHEGARGAVVGLVASYLAIGGFFLSFDFAHSFHVRFAIFLLPGLMVGWAAALAVLVESAMMVHRGERALIGKGLATGATLGAASLAMFVVCWARWAGAYYGGELQPARSAMAWVAQNTPADAIVGTRSVFLAQSLAFLNRRLPADQQRDYRFLGERPPSSHNAAMLARRWALERPVVLLDMASIDEPINVGYARFVAGLPVLARFGSNAPRDFFGFDRSLVVRGVGADPTAGRLPVAGADAHRAFPLDGFVLRPTRTSTGESATTMLVLPGSTTSTLIAAPGDTDRIALRIQVGAPPASPTWFVTTVDGQAPTLHRVELGRDGEATVALPVGLPANGPPTAHDVAMTFAMDAAMPPEVIGQCAAMPVRWTTTDEAPAPAGWSLSPDSAMRFPFDEDAFARALAVVPPPDYTASIGVALLGDITPTESPRLVAFRLETTGLSSHYVVPEIAWIDERGERRSASAVAGTRTSLSFGPVTHYLVIPPGWQGRDVEARVRLVRSMVQGPHGGHIRASAPALYELIAAEP